MDDKQIKNMLFQKQSASGEQLFQSFGSNQIVSNRVQSCPIQEYKIDTDNLDDNDDSYIQYYDPDTMRAVPEVGVYNDSLDYFLGAPQVAQMQQFLNANKDTFYEDRHNIQQKYIAQFMKNQVQEIEDELYNFEDDIFKNRT